MPHSSLFFNFNNNMTDLTLHQEEKFNEIFELINQGENLILLKGSAGVGKTWLVDTIIRELCNIVKPFSILCSAPTHKALSVIRTKVKASDIKFNTLHSALHYKAITNRRDGSKEFISMPNEKNPPLKYMKYWIIDEASMIDTVMLENILYHSKIQRVTVIFVGDEKQINPVGEDDSPVFLQGFPEVELTEIIRQGEGNPIITLSRNLPSIWSKENQLFGTESENLTGYLYSDNMAKIIEELAKVNGTDDFKYLAWTNEEVDKVNSLVRHRLYGDNPAKIELDETLVMNSPYRSGEYNTNEEVYVETLVKTKKIFPVLVEDAFHKYVSQDLELEVYLINADEIVVVAESSMYAFKQMTYLLNKNAKEGKLSFVCRNAFYDLFADFKYNHALTVHKSQGSTYKTTVLNVRNIAMNQNPKEKERLLYTGVTRSSELLILYNV
jgi:exodeoxyribonuclease-5